TTGRRWPAAACPCARSARSTGSLAISLSRGRRMGAEWPASSTSRSSLSRCCSGRRTCRRSTGCCPKASTPPCSVRSTRSKAPARRRPATRSGVEPRLISTPWYRARALSCDVDASVRGTANATTGPCFDHPDPPVLNRISLEAVHVRGRIRQPLLTEGWARRSLPDEGQPQQRVVAGHGHGPGVRPVPIEVAVRDEDGRAQVEPDRASETRERRLVAR